MFTGIIEEVGRVTQMKSQEGNLLFTIEAVMTKELKVDQSVAHNGVCLTVVAIDLEKSTYQVEAVSETLKKTALGALAEGDAVNLERAMQFNARLDGHIVQGHVDQTATCVEKRDMDGSWLFTFESDTMQTNLIIEKGSVAVNGVSLTTFEVTAHTFSVAVIPYTLAHTTFEKMKVGDKVNLEYDLIGKYVQKQLQAIKTPL
jgi:riboflavin synthase